LMCKPPLKVHPRLKRMESPALYDVALTFEIVCQAVLVQ
jgi:hypothetical protein